ncbi:MAG: TylF/MycF family methyltransferase [Candidatus Sumerlaeaceae bacterium]
MNEHDPGVENNAAELYLDLLKRSLTGLLRPQLYVEAAPPQTPWKAQVYKRFEALLASTNRRIVSLVPYEPDLRATGRECWPPEAESMIGLLRLENIQKCIQSVVRENIAGDVIETGVWRGGATIFMRAALEAYGDREKTVWVADSFEGLPPPDASYPADAGDSHFTYSPLAVSVEQVKENFRRYKLLDQRVRFLTGWFKDTLPSAPIERLSVLRLDGDMYQSTMDAISALYPKLSVGGYCIVDDYLWHKPCAQAVEDYCRTHGINKIIHNVDWTGVYWRRER